MSGMALLVLCAVSVDPNGWQPSQIPTGPVTADPTVAPAPATNFVTPQTPLTDALPAPPATTAAPPATTAAPPVTTAAPPVTTAAPPVTTADWSEIEQALNLPPGQPSRGHAGFPALRAADGASLPPQPPAEIANALPVAAQPPAGGFTNGAVTPEAHPLQGLPAPPNAAAPTVRQQAREVVVEQKLTQGSFSDRQYIAPPPRETETVVPLPNRDPQVRTEAKPVDLAASESSTTTTEEVVAAEPAAAPPAEKKWWPLMFTMLGLFASIGFNVYLGWIAFDIHGRYHEIADEVQDLEQKLESGARAQSSELHRERQQTLAS